MKLTRPRRLIVRATTGLIATSTALVLIATPAYAASTAFTDPNDQTGLDIRAVQVDYAGHLDVTVFHDGHLHAMQTYVLWIDTVRSNAGPEFYYAFNPNSDSGSLRRVSGFADHTKTRTSCQVAGGAADFLSNSDVSFTIASRCLGRPSRVRVSIQFKKADGSNADWAPGYRKLSDWVKHY